MRQAPVVVLSEEVRGRLTRLARGRTVETRIAERARILLLAAEGLDNKEIAGRLGVRRHTVGTWRTRFVEAGEAALLDDAVLRDAPRSGRPPDAAAAAEILRVTTQEKPPGGATHWSTRTLAAHLGLQHSLVQRVWKARNLQPHRTKTFKVSNDPRFEEKFCDVVGLYLDPPESAIVLSVDEKSQIQALDRTQKSLPMFPGRLGTMTHDYKRNGTTTLFAALNVFDGTVLADFKPRHRHQEWLDFLKQIDETYPDVELHVICDNYATHKHEKVRRWLARHPRFHVHFTPTSGSWLNLVERWFRDLTVKCVRRGSFKSVADLEAKLWAYIEHANDEPRPFKWTAKPHDVLAKAARARAALNKVAD